MKVRYIQELIVDQNDAGEAIVEDWGNAMKGRGYTVFKESTGLIIKITAMTDHLIRYTQKKKKGR